MLYTWTLSRKKNNNKTPYIRSAYPAEVQRGLEFAVEVTRLGSTLLFEVTYGSRFVEKDSTLSKKTSPDKVDLRGALLKGSNSGHINEGQKVSRHHRGDSQRHSSLDKFK
ncbi:hypothetical protein CHS0354_040226 [Potamilus streckersoni]|uniref:Uncharacterized protein n=1 Tax=Potamilus streckersoni TaxID=2493646 RepID=A0AAE0S4V9_9BIVA|nr:hypothetical protein CHS0354_040226 [Potamilus streckersoni]